jgi:hypothetical protein
VGVNAWGEALGSSWISTFLPRVDDGKSVLEVDVYRTFKMHDYTKFSGC